MLPLITLEEHYADPHVLEASPEDASHHAPFPKRLMDMLSSLGVDRVEQLETHSISLQILSHTPANPTPEVCRAANDRLASAIRQHPDRYAGFALLPLCDAEAAATELTRCVRELGFVGTLVNNHHKGSFYDNPSYWPLFGAAQDLDVPVYLHPTFPSKSMAPHYEGNYPDVAAQMLGCYGWGWHADTGLHILRLFAAGVFDRFPKLKVIIGHMGEMLPFQLDRIVGMAAAILTLQRGLREVWESNIWVTTSGMFSLAPMACLLRVMPAERIMLSVDYPFSENAKGRAFIDELEKSGLVSREELEGIAYRNAENLLRVKAAQE